MQDSAQLSQKVRSAIAEPANEVRFSLATVWEAEIKQAKGALRLPEQIWTRLEACNYVLQPITRGHCEAAARLPAFHRDPFDRMLIAQTLMEGMVLVTADQALSAYSVPILW